MSFSICVEAVCVQQSTFQLIALAQRFNGRARWQPKLFWYQTFGQELVVLHHQ